MELIANKRLSISNTLLLIFIPIVFCLSLSNYFYFATFSKLISAIIICLILIFNSKNFNIRCDYFKKYLIIYICVFPLIIFQLTFHQSLEGDFSLRVGLILFMIPFSLLISDDNRKYIVDLIVFILPITCVYAAIYSYVEKQPLIVPAGNPNALAIIISLGTLATMYQLVLSQKIKLKVFCILSLFLAYFLLFKIFSLGSFIIILVGGMSFLFFQINKFDELIKKIKYWQLLLAISVCILIVSMSPVIFHIFFPDQLINNLEFRLNLLEAGWRLAKDEYLFGIGSGKVYSVIPYYWNSNITILQGAGETVHHIHNEYLNILIENGIFVLIGFINLIAFAFYNGFKFLSNSERQNQNFIKIIICLFLGICVQISFSRSLHFPSVALIFFMLMSILIFCSYETKKNENKIKSKILIYLSCLGVFIFILPLLYEGYQLKKIQDNFKERNSFIGKNKSIINGQSVVAIKSKYKNYLFKHKNNLNANLIVELLSNKNTLSDSEELDFLLYLSDLEFDFESELKSLSKSSRYTNLKYLAYKNYLRLLMDYMKWDEVYKVSMELYAISPANLISTSEIYLYHIRKKEFQKGLEHLIKTYKIIKNPLLLKTIIEHKIKFTKEVIGINEITDCINLRRKIEFDSKYAKYQIDSRFGNLKQYYYDFLSILIKKGFDHQAKNLYLHWKKNYINSYPKEMIDKLVISNPETFLK
ncbi:MAG: hypothetical protein COA79_00405 [Planctomycetota bacterium]|nr:MAG: hypothetical protein COA79_00405 [Planctomycetota bacterium]